LSYEPDPYAEPDPEAEAGDGRTLYLVDDSHSVIARNDSPDVGFAASINPYRGCEHGCIYCFARPFHEYLDFSAGLDFETRILVKPEAPRLLRRELSSPKWKPQVVGLSGVTDPYQPIERHLKLTRSILGVLEEFRNPVVVITKSYTVTRDADILARLARVGAAAVCLSVTTLDPGLARRLEPRASAPERRLAAIARLREAGVPVGVLVAPVIPGLNDHELPAVVAACARAGASFAGYVALRLPGAVAGLFTDWLERHFPQRKEKVLGRLRSLRQGKLYDSAWFGRMRGEGEFARQIEGLFTLACRRAGLEGSRPPLSADSFRVPRRAEQLDLFG
jgi:DNA repair photolyase